MHITVCRLPILRFSYIWLFFSEYTKRMRLLIWRTYLQIRKNNFSTIYEHMFSKAIIKRRRMCEEYSMHSVVSRPSSTQLQICILTLFWCKIHLQPNSMNHAILVSHQKLHQIWCNFLSFFNTTLIFLSWNNVIRFMSHQLVLYQINN